MSDAPAPSASSPESAPPSSASPAVIDDSTIAPTESTSTCAEAAPEAPEAAASKADTSKPAKPFVFAKAMKSLKAPSIPPAAVAAAGSLDSVILRLNKITQTPAGIDALLAMVCYSARLGAVTLDTAAGRALLHEPAYRLAVLLASRPSVQTVLLSTSTSLKTEAAAAALVLSKRLRSLGSLLTEARMMLRLWALLSMYVWARSLVKQLLEKKTDDEKEAGPSRVEKAIGWTQLLTCIGYQVAENYAYLSSKGVLGASPEKQGALYLISSRSFAVYVAVELARGAYNIAHHGVSDTPAKKKAAVEMHRNFARYMAFAPMMTHWSMKKGFMTEANIAVCGFIPAALQFHKLWYEAA